jgi:hypothetical protein
MRRRKRIVDGRGCREVVQLVDCERNEKKERGLLMADDAEW